MNDVEIDGIHTGEATTHAPAAGPPASEMASSIAAFAACEDRPAALHAVGVLTDQALSRTGRGIDLTQADLSGLDLSGFDLRGATLNRASLFGTKLTGCNLTGASMVCAGIERTDFTDAKLQGAYVHALAAQASKFVRADLSGLVDATGGLFHGCDLTDARLDRAELAGTTFYQCGLRAASAVGADLHGAVFNECQLERIDLSLAHLDDAAITRSNLQGATLRAAQGEGLVIQRPSSADGLDLSEAHLPSLRLIHVHAGLVRAVALRAPGVDASHCHLPDIVMTNADLRNGRWSESCLDGGNFDDARLAGCTMWHVTARGASMVSATGEYLNAAECDLTGASMTSFAGRYATFRNCNMHGADLRGAYLYRAVIVGDPPPNANMTNARLDGANLTQAYLAADFTGASVTGGWATYARLNQSTFTEADLRGTSLFRASAVKTDFVNAQLGGQRGAIFADRCPGLLDALATSSDPGLSALVESVTALDAALTSDRGKST